MLHRIPSDNRSYSITSYHIRARGDASREYGVVILAYAVVYIVNGRSQTITV